MNSYVDDGVLILFTLFCNEVFGNPHPLINDQRLFVQLMLFAAMSTLIFHHFLVAHESCSQFRIPGRPLQLLWYYYAFCCYSAARVSPNGGICVVLRLVVSIKKYISSLALDMISFCSDSLSYTHLYPKAKSIWKTTHCLTCLLCQILRARRSQKVPPPLQRQFEYVNVAYDNIYIVYDNVLGLACMRIWLKNRGCCTTKRSKSNVTNVPKGLICHHGTLPPLLIRMDLHVMVASPFLSSASHHIRWCYWNMWLLQFVQF
jgi:hypothetical protein